jgi:peptide-methionine (S)-S-oxide reductase
VGYAGGTKENPTYMSLGDHSETIQIDYDPAQISYTELLEVFWQSHNPTSRPYSRQYMSAIFYHDEEQRRQAEESRESEEARRGAPILTEIVPFSGFTLAEEYHQKYRLQGNSLLMGELRSIYPDGGWIDSTVAARVNGILGGHGSPDELPAGIDGLGLSPEADEALLRIVEGTAR